MEAPQIKVQTRTAPLEENEDTARVGWTPDHAADEDVLGRKAGHVVAPEDRLPIKTDWVGMHDWVNAPPDYDTWARQYRDYTRAMLLRWGALHSELEDMMHDIMIRFIERDSIGVFIPSWGSKSETKKSNFRSYYSRFLLTYYKGKKRNNAKHYGRNVCILDAPVSDDGGTTWGDMHVETCDEAEFDRLEFAEVIAQLRGRMDGALLDAVLTLAEDGPVRQKKLSEVLGTDQRAARSGLQKVREALAELMGERV